MVKVITNRTEGKKSADKIYNRIMITHLLMDENKKNRVGGAVGLI